MVERVFYSMFNCGHDLLWRESFCRRFASLSSLQLTFKLKAFVLVHCCEINEKCFRKYGNHKTIEILRCESENLRQRNAPFQSYDDFVIFVHSSDMYRYLLLLIGFDAGTFISLPIFLSYLFKCVHNRISFSSISEP